MIEFHETRTSAYPGELVDPNDLIVLTRSREKFQVIVAHISSMFE